MAELGIHVHYEKDVKQYIVPVPIEGEDDKTHFLQLFHNDVGHQSLTFDRLGDYQIKFTAIGTFKPKDAPCVHAHTTNSKCIRWDTDVAEQLFQVRLRVHVYTLPAFSIFELANLPAESRISHFRVVVKYLDE